MTTEERCIVVRPPKREACGEPATFVLTFRDQVKALACQDCAIYLGEMAKAYGAPIQVVRR